MIIDFQNLSIEKIKELVLQYQVTKDPELFKILLARFDKYLLYLIHRYRNFTSFLWNEPMQELYHTSIIGFQKGLISYKERLQAKTIMLRIATYVINELRQTYRYKINENSCIDDLEVDKEVVVVSFPSCYNKYTKQLDEISVHMIMDSKLLTPKEKQLVDLVFFKNMTEAQISEKIEVSHSTVHRRIVDVLEKLKKELEHEDIPT